MTELQNRVQELSTQVNALVAQVRRNTKEKENVLGKLNGNYGRTIGLADEYLSYLELSDLPEPCKIIFRQVLQVDGTAKLELDLLLLHPGGLFLVEVKSDLSRTREVAHKNVQRVTFLRKKIPAIAGAPIYSIVAYHNERFNGMKIRPVVEEAGGTYLVHNRNLRVVVLGLASKKPKSLSEKKIDQIAQQLETLYLNNH
jgi:hypothetical protein